VPESLPDRLTRVARLDSAVFEEVASDPRATGGAIGVLLVANALDGLGSGPRLEGALLALAGGVLRSALWIGAIHAGAMLLGLGSGFAPVFRALGFASAPLAIGVLAVVPGLGGLVFIAKWALCFAAFAVGTSRALEADGATPILLAAVCLGLASAATGILF
jgi:hypothetical protein